MSYIEAVFGGAIAYKKNTEILLGARRLPPLPKILKNPKLSKGELDSRRY